MNKYPKSDLSFGIAVEPMCGCNFNLQNHRGMGI